MAAKLVHFEVPAKDAQRAKKFYASLFAWKFEDSNIPGVEYYMTKAGGDPGGAINPMDQKQRILVYFDTEDIDASVRRVRELGGKADEKMPIPGDGWFSNCSDTEGNEFGLYKHDPTAQMPQAATATEARS